MTLTTLGPLRVAGQAFFRHRDLGDHMLLTNREGGYLILDHEEFGTFARGEWVPGSELHRKLRDGNFLRETYDVQAAVERLKRRQAFLGSGPNLHILVVTLRCNETCVYCHSSRAMLDDHGHDMSEQTARDCIDLAFQSPSPSLTFEFQGGEPLVVFPVVKAAIEYALQKNVEAKKTIEFTLVSNLSLMTDEILEYLLERRVQICTSVDGPRHLHDRQRKLPAGSAHESAVTWIKRINEAYEQMGLDPSLYRVEALLTTTRGTLPLWKEVVDTYVELGCRALFLRPLDPFGFADKASARLGYPIPAFLEFYEKALDYMIELNARGVQIVERFAAIFLTKILTGDDPNYLDIRSPCGAGIGQIAYNYDGRIYTCDEGRMLHETGDDTFAIGEAGKSTYREVLGHETVRAMAIASQVEAAPDCVNCAYAPYCGLCPVHNHKTQGSMFGRMRESALCSVFMGIQDVLFRRLAAGDPTTLATLERWTTARPRTHFLQTCAT